MAEWRSGGRTTRIVAKVAEWRSGGRTTRIVAKWPATAGELRRGGGRLSRAGAIERKSGTTETGHRGRGDRGARERCTGDGARCSGALLRRALAGVNGSARHVLLSHACKEGSGFLFVFPLDYCEKQIPRPPPFDSAQGQRRTRDDHVVLWGISQTESVRQFQSGDFRGKSTTLRHLLEEERRAHSQEWLCYGWSVRQLGVHSGHDGRGRSGEVAAGVS